MAQNAPPRTANLRRSARLGGGGKSPSSMSISRHRSEIMPLAVSYTVCRVVMVTTCVHVASPDQGKM